MSVRLPDHLDLIATAPGGIQKLRGLILELAVRGKLVAQDPNDEPASELLKRIAKERARLEAEGVCKKPIATHRVGLNKLPFDVPDGWEWTTLGLIGETNIGLTYSPSNLSSVGIPVLRSSNVQNGIIDLSDLIRVNMRVKDSVLVRDGDLLICARNGSKALVGKTALISGLTEEMAFGAFMAIFRSIANPYLLYFINSPLFRRTIDDVNTTTINQITQGNLKATAVPLPPLAEQHRIVAKVDELMMLCDRLEAEQTDSASAHTRLVDTLLATLTQSTDAADLATKWHRLAEHFDTLFTTEASLEALKQTILQLAVMGKLVPQDPNDEPANELLKQIAVARMQLEAEGIRKKSKPTPPEGVSEQPFDIPKNWQWIQFAQLEPEYQNGESSRGGASGTQIVVLRLADISNGAISMSSTRAVTLPNSSIEKYRLLKNDILIIRVNGSAEIVGRLILCDEDLVAIYCDHFIRARISDTSIAPRYLRLIGDAPVIRDQIQSLFITTAGQKTVNQGHIGGLKTPLPPLAEQHRIVAKVDELMALCDQLKTGLATARTRQARLSATLIESALESA